MQGQLRRFLLLLCSLAGCLVLYALLLTLAGLRQEDCHLQPGLVLGNRVQADYTPSARLAARLDRALQLYQAGQIQTIIVSGGKDPEHGIEEAAVMASYLITAGVASERVISDYEGWTTRRSAENAARLAAQTGQTRIMVISQFYHLPRSRLALEQAGFEQVCVSHADFFEWRDAYSLAREMVALPVYAMRWK